MPNRATGFIKRSRLMAGVSSETPQMDSRDCGSPFSVPWTAKCNLFTLLTRVTRRASDPSRFPLCGVVRRRTFRWKWRTAVAQGDEAPFLSVVLREAGIRPRLLLWATGWGSFPHSFGGCQNYCLERDKVSQAHFPEAESNVFQASLFSPCSSALIYTIPARDFSVEPGAFNGLE